MTPSLALTHERNDFVSEFKERHGRNLATHNEALERIDEIERAARDVVSLCRSYRVTADMLPDIAERMVSDMMDATRDEYGLIGAAVAVEVENG